MTKRPKYQTDTAGTKHDCSASDLAAPRTIDLRAIANRFARVDERGSVEWIAPYAEADKLTADELNVIRGYISVTDGDAREKLASKSATYLITRLASTISRADARAEETQRADAVGRRYLDGINRPDDHRGADPLTDERAAQERYKARTHAQRGADMNRDGASLTDERSARERLQQNIHATWARGFDRKGDK